MRIILSALVVLAGIVFTAPANAQYCRCECYRTPHGRVCRQVCVAPPPRYVPAPQYTPRYVPAPQYQVAGPEIEPRDLAAIGLVALIAFAIIAAIVGASSDTTAREIAAIEQNSFDLYDQAHDTEHKTQAINSHIASEEADAYQRGRHAADRELEDYTRDRS